MSDVPPPSDVPPRTTAADAARESRQEIGLGRLGFEVGGCRIDVEGGAQHDTDDTWDANWLAITARCEGAGASVAVRCAVLTSWSVERFRQGLKDLARAGVGCALLASEEPCLSLCVRADQPGQPTVMRVDITPDHPRQGHWFSCVVEPAELGRLIDRCDAILAVFPTHELVERE